MTMDHGETHGASPWEQWTTSFAVASGSVCAFTLGPLRLWVRRGSNEWAFTWCRDEDPTVTDMVLCRAAAQTDVPKDAGEQSERFVCGSTLDSLTLAPRLGDRPIVSRPVSPVTVLPGERVSIWISTPLWVVILHGDGDNPITELPVVRMSDTWFGQNTREGHLCYATRTRARTHEPMEAHPVRALTRVEVTNRDSAALKIERLAVPIPNLALYRGANGWLTSEVKVLLQGAGASAEVEIAETSPEGASRICEAREVADGGGLLGGFQALLL